jgi:phosphotransferase system enzyme I (PtsI)
MTDAPLVLVAHDLSPADMLQFKRSVFAGFVTAVGGKTSHTAIVARSMDIPAVVGARRQPAGAPGRLGHHRRRRRRGDRRSVAHHAGGIPFRQRQMLLERERLTRLRTPRRRRWMARRSSCWPTSSSPRTAPPWSRPAPWAWGCSAANSCSWAGAASCPAKKSSTRPTAPRWKGMQGMPVTIRTIDVGADKPLEGKINASLNPALGLRAIRWSLAEPVMFRTQLRAILRAAAWQGQLLFPCWRTAARSRRSWPSCGWRSELDARGVAYGKVELGAMIEIPAAALMVRTFLQYFDFLSIGTNDLIQYTLAIDRADEAVAHLYDPLHPAVLQLVAQVIREANAAGKSVCVCGEMAGDVAFTRCCWAWGCAAFPCTRRRCWRSSRKCCAPTPASCMTGRRRCWMPTIRRRRCSRPQTV